MDYMTDEEAVRSVWDYYNHENGKEESKKENACTIRKRFEQKVLRLLTIHNVPYSKKDDEETYEDYLLSDDENTPNPKGIKLKQSIKTKPRDNDGDEEEEEEEEDEEDVDERIASIKNKLRQKKRPTTEKQQKRRVAKKLKRSKGVQKLLQSSAKIMKNENIKQNKLKNGGIKAESNDDGEATDSKATIQPVPLKPVFNEESKIVYSKIDFAANPGAKSKKSHQNPKEILKKLKDTRQQINELKEQGQGDKAAELQNNIAWKKAFDKIEGKKVKDDTKLLQKAIKKKKLEKRTAKKKWTERKQKVDHDIAKRQKKRQENLDKRSKDKKNKKLKKASKKGRIIPGY